MNEHNVDWADGRTPEELVEFWVEKADEEAANRRQYDRHNAYMASARESTYRVCAKQLRAALEQES